eukprot:10540187-Prorocentrum_lima.AAC.1
MGERHCSQLHKPTKQRPRPLRHRRRRSSAVRGPRQRGQRSAPQTSHCRPGLSSDQSGLKLMPDLSRVQACGGPRSGS